MISGGAQNEEARSTILRPTHFAAKAQLFEASSDFEHAALSHHALIFAMATSETSRSARTVAPLLQLL